MKMTELINKNIKTDIFTAFHMIDKIEEILSKLSRDMEGISSKSKTSKYENSNIWDEKHKWKRLKAE